VANVQVPENLTEPFRVRNFSISYYLVDDSVQINEHKQQNSGHAQGVFMKRHRVPKAAQPGQSADEFLSLFDFADTKTIKIYSREFNLTVRLWPSFTTILSFSIDGPSRMQKSFLSA
jgi:hypothetical protein